MADSSGQVKEKESPHEILKGTPSSGKTESLKGGSAFMQSLEDDDLDSGMSGMEVAHALGRLTQGRIHECVNNVLPEMVQALWVLVPNMVPTPALTSLQKVPVESSSSASRFLSGNQAKRVSLLKVSSTGCFSSSPVSKAWPVLLMNPPPFYRCCGRYQRILDASLEICCWEGRGGPGHCVGHCWWLPGCHFA